MWLWLVPRTAGAWSSTSAPAPHRLLTFPSRRPALNPAGKLPRPRPAPTWQLQPDTWSQSSFLGPLHLPRACLPASAPAGHLHVTEVMPLLWFKPSNVPQNTHSPYPDHLRPHSADRPLDPASNPCPEPSAWEPFVPCTPLFTYPPSWRRALPALPTVSCTR